MDLIDALVVMPPTSHLFALEAPKYASQFGRRTEAVFKHNVPPSPMAYTPDAGLGEQSGRQAGP